ncbi:MAG: hypothetical protein JSW47_05875, partial [Phycisphaerales bacterium]
VMDRADRALDAVWPERKGVDYVREMQSAAEELKEIVSAMRKKGDELIEQSRTYRYLGSVYSDLAPALGKKMLTEARNAYSKAETLLKDCDDELERAKLNFNFANTLRQIDPDNFEQLQEAKRRFLFAKKVFSEQSPQHIQQVDTALSSVESLLKIAPLVSEADRKYAEAEALEEELKSGENLPEIMMKAREVMKKGGGVHGLIGRVQVLMSQLPPELQQSEKFTEIREKMGALTGLAISGGSMDNQEAQIMQMLRDRLEAEFQQEKVSEDRAETMRGLLGQLDTILSGDDEDVQVLMERARKLRDAAGARFDTLHYLSHGIPRPPKGSRSAELVENCWLLRRFLMEEMNRPNKGSAESKEVLDLNVQATRVDKRIYEAGADNKRAEFVDKDEFRPLVLTVRAFSARTHSMLAKPIWPLAHSAVDTNAVFYSGPVDRQSLVAGICRKLGLSMMQTPSGENVSNTRWKQLQSAMTTVFDLGFEDGPARAAVAYELGMALTLGKPIVVIATRDWPLPFDVDINPVIFSGDQNDEKRLASAIDRSIVWTYDRTRSKDFLVTADHILSKYSRPYPDTYVDQTLRLLEDQKKDPDSLMLDRTIAQLVNFLKDGAMMQIHPVWSPVYPKTDHLRLFHVMPYRPKWADDVTLITRRTCEAGGVEYVRGDEMEDPNVIHSIWEEIAQATHVVVDLTGFSANVALELGITHTLGRPSLLVGQGNTVNQLFPMIAKLRFQTYKDTREIETLVQDFLT